jgi:chromosome segregation ATPase
MGKVYESLKEVVKLQLSKNDPIQLAEVKQRRKSTLDEEIDQLVQRISGLKAAVKHREEAIKNETLQLNQALSEELATIKDKLKDAEETLLKKDSVSRTMEERLTAEIQTLQKDLNTKTETLQTRDDEIKDLKSNLDVTVKQVTELERSIKQEKADAATEANRTEQVKESLKTTIAALEAQIGELKETVKANEAAIKSLEENLAREIQHFENQLSNKETTLIGRDREINDLKSKLQVLTGKIQEMTSFLKQAEALAAVEGQNTGTLTSEPRTEAKQSPVNTLFKVSPAPSNEQTNVSQQTVSRDFFDLVSQELTAILGPQAPMILNQHVKTLGGSIEKFPKSQLAELLELLSQSIVNEPLRIGFRKWFVKQRI